MTTSADRPRLKHPTDRRRGVEAPAEPPRTASGKIPRRGLRALAG
jgi:acyl-coenzyme A synthetase/AMP-(fatty) acid ligase